MKKAVRDFKEFVLKGDVVALAVAVIIATAFGAVIAAFVPNIITPLIAAVGGQPDFADLTSRSTAAASSTASSSTR
jgi:large conductance mechanosensitive channel